MKASTQSCFRRTSYDKLVIYLFVLIPKTLDALINVYKLINKAGIYCIALHITGIGMQGLHPSLFLISNSSPFMSLFTDHYYYCFLLSIIPINAALGMQVTALIFEGGIYRYFGSQERYFSRKCTSCRVDWVGYSPPTYLAI